MDPDFPVLWEEMAASASGRSSSSSWLLHSRRIKEKETAGTATFRQRGGVFQGRTELLWTHKLNCRTSRFLRLLLVLALACSLSGVGLRSCQCDIFSVVRLDAAESWDEFWFLRGRIPPGGVTGRYINTQGREVNDGTHLSGRVSFRCFTLGVVGASFVTVKKRTKVSE